MLRRKEKYSIKFNDSTQKTEKYDTANSTDNSADSSTDNSALKDYAEQDINNTEQDINHTEKETRIANPTFIIGEPDDADSFKQKHSILALKYVILAIIGSIIVVAALDLITHSTVNKPDNTPSNVANVVGTVTQISTDGTPSMQVYFAQFNETDQITLLGRPDMQYIVEGHSYNFERTVKNKSDGLKAVKYKLLVDTTAKNNVIYTPIVPLFSKDKVLGTIGITGYLSYKYEIDGYRTTDYCIIYTVNVNGNKYNCVNNIDYLTYQTLKIGQKYMVNQTTVQRGNDKVLKFNIVGAN